MDQAVAVLEQLPRVDLAPAVEARQEILQQLQVRLGALAHRIDRVSHLLLVRNLWCERRSRSGGERRVQLTGAAAEHVGYRQIRADGCRDLARRLRCASE